MPEELYVSFIERIRLGAFPHIAAQSLGISPPTFAHWMRLGEEGKSRLYSLLYEDVLQASAEARISREIYVAEHMPLEWLKLGPGKTTKTSEGWTERKEESKTVTQDIRIEEVQKAGIMGDALKELADLGLISITPDGQTAFKGLPSPSDEDVIDATPVSLEEKVEE